MRIAMIGLKALPPRYGGFETAADEIGRRLVKLGHEVIVYNRSGLSTHDRSTYEGIRLVTLPTLQTKNLSAIFHSLLCSLHVLFLKPDVVHYFITGTTLFAPLPRMCGAKTVCSVDGTDWQRKKWGRLARSYLRFSERFASRVCHGLVSDSLDVQAYYKASHGAESSFIPYGMRETNENGTEFLEQLNLKPREYVLFVGRLVPENNVHLLIPAFEAVKTDKKLVIVGDDPWGHEYVRSLKETRDPRVIFAGGLYGKGYVQLQKNAYAFVLPDEVGGTHPSLVEAMGFGNCVLVNDTPSNLEVIGDAGFSYAGADGRRALQDRLQFLLDRPEIVEEYRRKALQRTQACYRWDDVVRKHIELYEQLMGKRAAEKQDRIATTPVEKLGPSPALNQPESSMRRRRSA
ncbi:MAG TPA: glycosyltransferase [Candidatus Acidoferrales bacterium]|nr:glycosyltransferase [Candidatus Acidoferrales bacterium]